MRRSGRPPKIPIEARPAWAQRLVQAREAAGLTNQSELCEPVGKSQSTLSAYETGESEPDIATWERLGKALKVSPVWLAFGVEPGLPDDGDSAIWRLIAAHENDRRLAEAIGQVARMLAEEQVGTNIAFIFRLALRMAREAQGIPDDLEAREAIRRKVEEERVELRDGLDKLRKSRE